MTAHDDAVKEAAEADVIDLDSRRIGGNLRCACGQEWWELTAVLVSDPATPRLDGTPGIRLGGYALPIRCNSCGTELEMP